MADWLDFDQYDADMATKAQLLVERHDEVFATLDLAGVDEGAEVLELVRGNLRTYHPEREIGTADAPFDTSSGGSGLHPLDEAGRLVPEDLCIMGERNGQLILTGASLCFPGRWRLADKLGKTMFDIHVPVARYQEHIGAATDGLLARLSVDKPVWRLNWSIVDDATLFQPTGHGRAVQEGAVDIVESADLFVRVERQALIRLPITNAILFSIRTYVTPLPEAVSEASDRVVLAETLRQLPEDVLEYKSMSSFAASLIEWLGQK